MTLDIIVATIASIVLGFLWYGPLFGKAWVKGMGFTPAQQKKMKAQSKKSFPGMIISTLVMVYVLWKLLGMNAVSDMGMAAMLGFWIWLGFVATTQFGSVLWEGKPKELFFVNAAYSLVNLVLASVLLTLL